MMRDVARRTLSGIDTVMSTSMICEPVALPGASGRSIEFNRPKLDHYFGRIEFELASRHRFRDLQPGQLRWRDSEMPGFLRMV